MNNRITAKEIASLIGLSPKHTADRITHRKDFPKPYRFGRMRQWPRDEVIAWIESRRES